MINSNNIEFLLFINFSGQLDTETSVVRSMQNQVNAACKIELQSTYQV